MSVPRFTLRAAVYLILKKENKILLLRRFNTPWRNGQYTLPAGHLDGNETITDTMAREAREETGLIIKPKNLSVFHTAHQMGEGELIDFYLTAHTWRGEPSIREPNKCDDMGWFPLNDLPKNLLPNVRDALRRIKKGETFSEFNWSKPHHSPGSRQIKKQ